MSTTFVTVVFVLTGAYAGKTKTLGTTTVQFPFQDGKCAVSGPAEDVARIAKFLERSYEAYPEGHPKLKEVAANGQRDVSTNKDPNPQPDLHGGGEPGGVQLAPGGEGDDSGGAGDPPAGNPGEVADGDGPPPELNEKLARAVHALDPATDAHWTSDGKPALTAVQAAYGSAGIGRADVNAAAPGYSRKTARALAAKNA